MLSTTVSSCFFSRPSSWAFLGSFQTAGSSSDALTVLRRSDLASKSKIPPEVRGAALEVSERGADEVGAFCVHGAFLVLLPPPRRWAAEPAIFSRRGHGQPHGEF